LLNSSGRRQRQRHCERAAASLTGALRDNRPSVRLHHLPNQRKTKTEARWRAALAFSLLESIED
jgi:hypothetical protein